MNRRNFACNALALFGIGCNQVKPSKTVSECWAENPRNTYVRNVEIAIAKELGAKLQARGWKIEECENNLFPGLPNLIGKCRIHWGYTVRQNGEPHKWYFSIYKYPKTESIYFVGKTHTWQDFTKDSDTRIVSTAYELTPDEASQIYINLAHGIKPYNDED